MDFYKDINNCRMQPNSSSLAKVAINTLLD